MVLYCVTLSVIRTVDHCVKIEIEIEIEIEAIRGFAAVLFDLGLATQSHLLVGHRVEELKWTSMAASFFIESSLCRLMGKYEMESRHTWYYFVPLLYTYRELQFCEHGK